MWDIGERERATQNRIVELIKDKLGYTYIGKLSDQDNSNIDEEKLEKYLFMQDYPQELIKGSIHALKDAAKIQDLYYANKEVYSLLRYGFAKSIKVGTRSQRLQFINWEDPLKNDFYIAEEVTIRGQHTKRPDIVLYINGIAICVLELKRSIVSVSEGIRQNLDNQTNDFIRPFFATIQLVMAGNDSEGLRIGVIQTPEKYFIEWKEDGKATDLLSLFIKEQSENEVFKVDRHIISTCQKERLMDILYNFIVFDSGVKKICRHNQYFGVMAAKQRINAREGGIIWHTQGSGKSLTMVWLSRWIKENNPHARVLIVTDREELDDQIESKVFGPGGTGDEIYRTKSSADLIQRLSEDNPRVICSLVHKFGRSNGDEDKAFDSYVEQLKASLPTGFKAKGEFFVFVDECHRTQSGKLHQAMSFILPDAVFIGFTGTPLLSRKEMMNRGIMSSEYIFGTYIHTYKYTEAVADKVVLDLRYEARDIPQNVISQDRIDQWFDTKTRGLTELSKMMLKKRWGTLREVYSSEARLSKIVADIIFDMETKDRLINDRGNAILVAASIYEACKYYKLFTDNGFKKCSIVTSYSAEVSEIKGEATGESRDTENRFKYDVYQKMLNGRDVESYEKEVKERFIREPGQMKLLIVVDKLLTGFDAPSATYLYIDKSMRDHGLFQAICRVNRLDGDDKEYGYIIDYMDLFNSLEKAVDEYTSGAFDSFETQDVTGLLKKRSVEAMIHLEELLESLRALCEPIRMPRAIHDFIKFFCFFNDGDLEELETNKPKRLALYKFTASLLRAFADAAPFLQEMGYTESQFEAFKTEVSHFQKVRDVIKLASCDYIDLKKYEADMRHLIDTYISADPSEKLSAFDDMTLIDLIVERGVSFEDELPEEIRKNKESAAEVIENNVRRKIVEKSSTNPLYYEKMSELLMRIIEERKNRVEDYKEYLQKIVELTKRVVNPEDYQGYPDSIRKSEALRALYDNFSHDIPLLHRLHKKIIAVKPDKWLEDQGKEKIVLRGIGSILNNQEMEEKVLSIVREQKEYR